MARCKKRNPKSKTDDKEGFRGFKKGLNKQIYRLLDANANRAREGLRVLEDIARFIMDDETLTRQLKGERHKITSLLRKVPGGEKLLLKARDSDTDVGSRTYPFSEGKRAGISEVVISNFRRSQEAIRVLEEVTKIFKSDFPRRFKAMRFRLYTLEKKFRNKAESTKSSY